MCSYYFFNSTSAINITHFFFAFLIICGFRKTVLKFSSSSPKLPCTWWYWATNCCQLCCFGRLGYSIVTALLQIRYTQSDTYSTTSVGRLLSWWPCLPVLHFYLLSLTFSNISTVFLLSQQVCSNAVHVRKNKHKDILKLTFLQITSINSSSVHYSYSRVQLISAIYRRHLFFKKQSITLHHCNKKCQLHFVWLHFLRTASV